MIKRNLKAFTGNNTKAAKASDKAAEVAKVNKEEKEKEKAAVAAASEAEEDEGEELEFEFKPSYVKLIVNEILSQINKHYKKSGKELGIKLRKLRLSEKKNYKIRMKFNMPYDEDIGGILVESMGDTMEKEVKGVKVITDKELEVILKKEE